MPYGNIKWIHREICLRSYPPPPSQNHGQPNQTRPARARQPSKSSAQFSQSAGQSALAHSQPPQQFQTWQPMAYPQHPFPYPPPMPPMPPMPNYYMYPPMPTMPPTMSQPQPQPGTNQNLNIPTFSPTSMFPRQIPTSPSASDYSNHSDRRWSYDPGLSPVIHVWFN